MDLVDVQVSELMIACRRLSKELKRFNIDIEPFSSHARTKSSGLSPLELAEIIKEIEAETYRYSTTSECEYTGKWEHVQLWSFLKENNYKFSDVVFPKLEDGCFVEVYGKNSRAVYRSPNFYRETSYSVGDLFVSSWNELFSRDEEYVEQILTALDKISKSEVGTVLNLDSHIKSHHCVERYSPEKRTATIKPLFFSVLERKAGERFLIIANKLSNLS